MKKEYTSEALMVSHQSAESLFRLGIIDAHEMKEFDKDCLNRKSETAFEAETLTEIEHPTEVVVSA
jgi:DNA-binding transcriptional regulator YiaG